MIRDTEDKGQALQRVKVGMTGLAGVIVLIGLASAVFSSATHHHGRAPDAVTAANAMIANSTEPLAEIGVAPGASETFNSSAPAPAGR